MNLLSSKGQRLIHNLFIPDRKSKRPPRPLPVSPSFCYFVENFTFSKKVYFLQLNSVVFSYMRYHAINIWSSPWTLWHVTLHALYKVHSVSCVSWLLSYRKKVFSICQHNMRLPWKYVMFLYLFHGHNCYLLHGQPFRNDCFHPVQWVCVCVGGGGGRREGGVEG